MKSDPLGLFPERQATQKSAASGGGGGGVGWLVVGLLLGVALLFGYQRFVIPGGDQDDRRDQQDERRDKKDEKEKDATPAVKGKTLVFIHERNPQPIEHDMLLRQMDDYVKSRGLQYRALDDDMRDEQTVAAIAFGKSKGIDPPLVVLTDMDDKPVRVIKWPATIDGLGEIFK